MTIEKTATNQNTPPVRDPETGGLRGEKRDATRDEGREAPAHPDTSGTPDKSKGALPDPFESRRSDAPRQAGETPRPTDRPIR